MIKKILFTIVVFVLPVNTFASTQVIIGGAAANLITNTTNWQMPQGGDYGAWTSFTENNAASLVSSSGTISNFTIKLSAAPGDGKSYVFAFRIGTTTQSVTCTVSNTNDSCSDTSNSFSVSPGDNLHLQAVPSGTPTAAHTTYSFKFESTVAKESIYMHGTTNPLATANRYLSLLTRSGAVATEATAESIMATSGTFKNLYVALSASPGSGKSRAITVRKNGSSTAVTCTISNTNTTCNDVSNSFTFVAGDRIAVLHVPSGTPTAAHLASGLTMLADTDGEFLIPAVNPTALSTSANRFTQVNSGGGDPNATETTVDQISNAMTLKSVYIRLQDVITSGSYVLTLNQNTVGSSLTCTITSQTCNAAVDVTVTSDQMLSFAWVPSSPSNARAPSMGMLGYIAPTASQRRIILTT